MNFKINSRFLSIWHDFCKKYDKTEKIMRKKLTDIIPKIPQYDGIEYAGDFNCPHCDKSGFYEFYGEERQRPNIVGWCETNIGYMGIFECPHCFTKYRYHNCTTGRSNWESFKSELFLVWVLEERFRE